MRTCQHCQRGFEIAERDLKFYEKISPVFNGKKYMIPEPVLCPAPGYHLHSAMARVAGHGMGPNTFIERWREKLLAENRLRRRHLRHLQIAVGAHVGVHVGQAAQIVWRRERQQRHRQRTLC